MLRVLGMGDLTPHEKIVLAALAYHDGPGGCYPSIQTVADYVNLHRATVTRHIRTMKKKGLLTSKRRGQKFNQYTINYGVPDVTPVATSEKRVNVTDTSPRCSTPVTSDVAPAATQTGSKPEYKPERGASFEIPKSDSNGSARQELENAHPATDKNNFFKCLDRVSGMTAGKPITSEGKQGLWEALKNLPPERVAKALNNHCQDNKFFPTLAEIKNQLLRVEQDDLVTRRQGWKSSIVKHNAVYEDKINDDGLDWYIRQLEDWGLGEITTDMLDMAFTVNHDRNGFWPSPERLKCIILDEPEPPRSTTNH